MLFFVLILWLIPIAYMAWTLVTLNQYTKRIINDGKYMLTEDHKAGMKDAEINEEVSITAFKLATRVVEIIAPYYRDGDMSMFSDEPNVGIFHPKYFNSEITDHTIHMFFKLDGYEINNNCVKINIDIRTNPRWEHTLRTIVSTIRK